MAAFRILFVAILSFVVVAGCGKSSKKDQCADVDCEFGVCDPDSGECVNPGECSDSAPCLEGYDCVEGTCGPAFECDGDGACERGVCQAGACVNPDRCDVDDDCVPGYGCDGDQCIEDQCDLVDCPRGVCEKSTGECVNAAVCTVESQETDCLEDFVCYDQSCADEETVCSDLDCPRGVCSYTDQECVNADQCSGDQECLEGYFCGDDGSCQENVCDANATSCSRGVCDPLTGDCVNADPCTAFDECADGFFCVEDACVDQTEACETCSGNQVCDYDQNALEIVCSENPDGCNASIDCLDGRVCESGECTEPTPCEDDAFEPNDSEGEATVWFSESPTGAPLSGSICSGDADWYAFDTNEDDEFTGTLVATVTIPAEQVGIAPLDVELFDPSGTSVADATLETNQLSARLEYEVGNIDQGIYHLAITEGGDVGTGGLDYQVYVDLLDENAADACANAMLLDPDGTGDTSMSMSNALGSSCTFDAGATEDVWTFELTDPSSVTLTLDSDGWDGVVSLRTQCASDASELECSNETAGGGTETVTAQLEAGPYYVVVQGNSGSEAGPYSLSLATEPLVCTPGESYCADMDTAEVCNATGTGFDMETCTLGCDMATGRCIREPGDVCSTAYDANGGWTGTVTLGALQNDYDATCVPDSFGDSATAGPDAVFNLTLGTDEVLYATVDPADFDDLSLYVVDDCADVSASCQMGVNDDEFSGPEEIIYENGTGADQELWLMLDSESGATGDVDVEIVTGPVICTPGDQQCNGDDLETCNDAGIGYDSRTCNFGCDTTAVACVPPPNDACTAGAIDVSAGGTFTGTIDDYADDYSDPSVCTGFDAVGPDAIYTYTGTVGDIVTVTLDTPYDSSLYAVTDCGDIFNSCLAGSDAGQPEEIEFVVETTDPIYIVADAYSSSPSGDFTLDVSTRSPDCTNYGEAVMCEDASTLQYCSRVGEFATYTCASTCSAGACDMPAGDRCFDAIPLSPNDSFSGSYADYEKDLDPGYGTCILSQGLAQAGPDAVFEVQLSAGDILTADLTTDAFGAGMYVLTGCADPKDQCAWAQPQEKQLQYFAPTSGTYYLVVDTTSFSASDMFTLDLSTASGFSCQPDATTCDSTTDTLNVCNTDGTVIESTINCANGCHAAGYCNAPTTAPDTCADATLVTGPARFFENHGRFVDDYDPGAVTNTCDLTDTAGPDLVYEVPLVSGQVVDVTVDDLGASGSPSVYFATDCSDVANTCLDSATDFGTVRAGHIASVDQTVYVFVDHSISSSSPLLVDIDVRTAECAPGSKSCTGTDQREYCNDFGELVAEDCFFGCTAGECDPPTNDTCSMPLDITSGESYTLTIDDYTDDYDPATAANSCTGFSAEGPDAVFQFTGQVDDVVTLTVDSEFDAAVYVHTTCTDTDTCIAGADDVFSSGTEEISFVVPNAGDYYVVVDSYNSSPTGTFTLDFTVEVPICTPLEMTCDGAGAAIDVCGPLGLTETSVDCDTQGCTPGESFCTNQNGERCVEAIDANAGGQFTGDYANFADDYNADSLTSCTGFQTPGTDAVYYVDLTDGQTVTADLDAPNIDSALSLVRSCVDMENACVDGDDVGGTGEQVTHTASGDERLFIVVDAFESAPSGMYTLDVTIN